MKITDSSSGATAGQNQKAVHTMTSPHARWPRVLILILLGYEGLGGLSGGGLLVASPDGRYMKMPVDMMHGVFPDFFIPGMILLLMGGLTTLAFILVLRKSNKAWLFSNLAFGGYTIWFIVEIIILGGFHWLHAMWGLPVLAGWFLSLPKHRFV